MHNGIQQYDGMPEAPTSMKSRNTNDLPYNVYIPLPCLQVIMLVIIMNSIRDHEQVYVIVNFIGETAGSPRENHKIYTSVVSKFMYFSVALALILRIFCIFP